MTGPQNHRGPLLLFLMEPWGPETRTSDDGVRFQYFTVLALLGTPTLFVYGVYHTLFGDIVTAVWDLSLVGGVWLGWFYYRRSGNWLGMFRASFLALSGLFLYHLIIGGGEGSQALWIYVLPLITLLNLGRREGMVWAGATFTASALVMFASGRVDWIYPYPDGFRVRFLVVLFLISCMAVWAEGSRQRYRDGMAQKHQKLQAALDEVKALSGFLPICAHCHRIRDDTGYWNALETFIQDRSEAQFSHGVCPECVSEHYSEDS